MFSLKNKDLTSTVKKPFGVIKLISESEKANKKAPIMEDCIEEGSLEYDEDTDENKINSSKFINLTIPLQDGSEVYHL